MKTANMTWKALAVSALLSGMLLPGTTAGAAEMPLDFTWDCLVNGNQGRGIAFLTFHGDFTLSGTELMTVNPPPPPPDGGDDDANPRGTGTDTRGDSGDSRGGTSGTTGGSTSLGGTTSANPVLSSPIYGAGDVLGAWGYDLYGRVVGYIQQTVAVGSGTNQLTITNSLGFRAIITGDRLTLVASVPGGGKSTYLGKLMGDMPDLSGSWLAVQKGTGQQMVEFFEVLPTWQPGVYDVFGSGGGYGFQGRALLSARKRVGFAVFNDANGVLRSTVGTYYPGRGKALMSGLLQPSSRIKYNATRLLTGE